jgi:hypothetical protein
LSLGIAFKGAEGIVLAADSRVTLTSHHADTNTTLPAYYDNATKLLKVKGQAFVGAVTYGRGALGETQPRTAHSYIPEFEQELVAEVGERTRLSVEGFATKLSGFFQRRWEATMPPETPPNDTMVFLVGGYDEDAAYGRVFQVVIPTEPAPQEFNAGNEFGITWGGQGEIASRLIHGFDPNLDQLVRAHVHLNPAQTTNLREKALQGLAVPIPYQFLPLQDCVDLAIFLVKATATMQKWMLGIRGVGGAVDIATITRTEGFQPVQQKVIEGERVEF